MSEVAAIRTIEYFFSCELQWIAIPNYHDEKSLLRRPHARVARDNWVIRFSRPAVEILTKWKFEQIEKNKIADCEKG